MDQQAEYQRRLAELDAAVAGARLDSGVAVDRAAGLLAGRVGCPVSEAHAYLLRRATEQRRDPGDVAADVLSALEERGPSGTRRTAAVLERALRARRHRTADRPPTARPAERPPASPAGQRAGDPAEDWIRVSQQLLDGLPGNHLLFAAQRDAAGRLVDLTVVAASPEASDLSGRRGSELVGLRVSQAYPATVNGPVWQGAQEVLATGEPRDLGPVSYPEPGVGPSEPAIYLTHLQPVSAGVLNSWIRHDEQTRLPERIAQTERLGRLGWGEADLVTGAVVWSHELYRIYERDPALGPLPGDEQQALTLPEDAAIHRQAAESFGRGETVDITYRIRVGGRIKHLRAVLDAVRDAAGRPLKVYGIVQDVTAPEQARARLVEVERQLREHRQNLAAEHRLAAQLQQIVLPIPATPVDLPGLRVAVRYLPAEQANRVGGDWYHAAATDDGRVVLAIGDVAGHGIHAATAMAQLRHMLAGLAITTTTDPAELLSHLNQLLYAARDTASAIVARYDPATRTLEWAQGGHPAPLRTRAGATVQLPRPPGPLLGAVRSARYGVERIRLEPGDLLLCYTDGLIEHRDRSLDEGLAPVIATLNRISAAGSGQPLADLLGELRRANPNDDTCILAVRPLLPRRRPFRPSGQ